MFGYHNQCGIVVYIMYKKSIKKFNTLRVNIRYLKSIIQRSLFTIEL